MRWIAWLALLAVVMPAAAAQTRPPTESLRVGKVELSLGMPQKAVLYRLRGQFHVEQARGAGDAWAVIDHGKTIAVVSFSADHLSRVSKTWMTTGGRDATTLADQLYSLAGEFSEQDRTSCTLVTKPYKVGKVEGRVVALSCGNKSIQIIQSRTPKSPWVTSLQEVLQ